MKKIFSVFMAVVMIFSCVGVMGASAAEKQYIVKTDLGTVNSLDDVMDKEVFGVPVDNLYNGSGEFQWTELDIRYPSSDAGGSAIEMPVTKSDIALAKGNVNTYLKRFLVENYIGNKLYTEKNATNIANFLGNLFYPDFEKVQITFPDPVAISDDEFFAAIADKSGLGDLIQDNWVGKNIDFIPMMTLFGVLKTNVLDREYADGHAIAAHILRAFFQKILEFSGPVNYIMDLFSAFVTSYNSVSNTYSSAINALFALKTNAGVFSESEIQTATGLLNAIFNDLNGDDKSSYQFIELPESRMALAKDTSELSLYILMYLAINYHYANNAAVVNKFITSTLPSYLNTVNTSYDKESEVNVKAAIILATETVLTGDISKDALEWTLGLTNQNVGSLGNDIWSLIRNSLSGFFQRIAEWFDNILKVLSGEKKFGEA